MSLKLLINLTAILNVIIWLTCYPTKQKTAGIIPVLKRKKERCPHENYRPISFLGTISKVLLLHLRWLAFRIIDQENRWLYSWLRSLIMSTLFNKNGPTNPSTDISTIKDSTSLWRALNHQRDKCCL